MSPDPFGQKIASAFEALSRGDLTTGRAMLQAVLSQGEHPVALYLLGMVESDSGRWAEAELLLRRALRFSPIEPRRNIALARSVRMQGRPQEAIAFCQTALRAAPNDSAILLETGLAQQESGALAEAEATYRHILINGPDPTALVNLGHLLSGDGRTDEAAALLENALTQAQGDPVERATFSHQLGSTRKFQRRFEEALALMDQAQDLDPRQNRARALERAALLRHLGRNEEVVETYRAILAGDPLDSDVHVLLNEVLLAQKRESEFLTSYDLALKLRPDASLAVGKGMMLIQLNRAAEAEGAFRAGLAIAPASAALLTGLGRALEMLGEIHAAETAHSDSIRVAPEDGEALEGFAGFLLRQGHAGKALALIERARRARPVAQTAMALQGLCWRALDDTRDAWLNDYEGHVQIFDLEPPDGYADMADFNRDLASYLSGLHEEAQQYLTQSLRGGTQTHENIFGTGHRLADKLLPRINEALRTYVQRVNSSSDHPLVSRRGKGARYAGSWSSCLSDRGFHVNHTHKGWISSCYYVALPNAIEDEKNQQGWIQFGEPSAEFAGRFAPMRAIKPKLGRLVLFPSYMWHGTVPFHANQKRITIAFDVVPL